MSHNYNGHHMYCTTTPPIHPIARQVNVTTALSKLNLTNTSALEPGIGGKSPPVTEPQFTTGNRFRLWLIIAIRNSPDARNNRH